MKLQELKNKKILILGFGKEGQDSFFALRKMFPDKVIGIADEKKIKVPDNGVKFFWGKDYLSGVGEYEVVIKTPGIPLSKIEKSFSKGTIITSQTNIFFDNFEGTIVGVTGTKGKGTVASLIYHILKKAGKDVELVGNIGEPVFQKLVELEKESGEVSDKIFVYELSSHQLQSLKKSPHIAVFTNLFSDHLDYYNTLKEYQDAKVNITKYQTKNDYFIYNTNDKKVAEIAKITKAQKVPIKVISTRYQSHLKGDFNDFNIELAVRTVKVLNAPESAIKAGILAFSGLPHRLEFLGKYQGIDFYNDSMSTIPEVTIVTLKSLKNITTLLVGGSPKGSDYSQLARVIVGSKVKTLIVLGQGTGQKVWQEIERINSQTEIEKFEVSDMKKAVEIAYNKTEKGKVCLLSPGAASFNMFKDYQDRGDQFKKMVIDYAKKTKKKNKK